MSTEKNSENTKLYEVGFHITSFVSLEDSVQEFNKIKDLIKKHKGELVKESEPQTLNLAYTIIKKIKGANQRFRQAHFAWIKFNMDAEEMVAFKEEMETLENVIRFLIVKASEDEEHSTNKMNQELLKEQNSDDEDEEDSEKKEVNEEVVEDAPEESKKEEKTDEIDEAIDEMVK